LTDYGFFGNVFRYFGGEMIWTKQWGTSEEDQGRSIAIDSSGNIYVAGTTFGGIDENDNKGLNDIFITKWDAEGKKIWTKQFGTQANDFFPSIAVDSSGFIYVSGTTWGKMDEGSDSAGSHAFLKKLNNKGDSIWTKEWGSDKNDSSTALALDSSGNIYLTGYTSGNIDENQNKGGVNCSGNCQDIFLTKWNNDGTYGWTKQWGSSGDDQGLSLFIDSSDNIYVTGFTGRLIEENSTTDTLIIFLSKITIDGTLLWTEQLKTQRGGVGLSLAFDSKDNIYITGTIGSSDDIDPCGFDIFLTMMNPDGYELWTKQWGSVRRDEGNAIAIDGDNIYIAGSTGDSLDGNVYLGEGCIDITGENCPDVFITKFKFE
jgi:hypothetical protein